MIEKFLRAKHWQLFLLTFGIPIIIQILMTLIMFVSISSGNDDDSFLLTMLFFPIVMIVFIGTQFGWFWSVAIGLQSKVPENVKMKVKKFKLLFFIPLIYIITISILVSFLTIGITESGEAQSPELLPGLFLIIIPLHLFSMFCIFYSLYFVAKTFKTVELQREVSFSDFAGEFFMIWFYPIGIWIIQPKINKMIDD